MKEDTKSRSELINEIQKLQRENEELRQALSAPARCYDGLTGSETILVVDDNDETRAVVAAMLEDLNYKTIETESPEQALAVFAKQQDTIDLVLADIVMPDTSGPEMARKMLDRNPGLKVVFMSGYAEDEIVHDDVFKIQHSDAAFIKKPFTLQDIGILIRKRLEA